MATKAGEVVAGGPTNVYHFRPITGLAMFEEEDGLKSQTPANANQTSMSPQRQAELSASVCAGGHAEMPPGRPVCPLCDLRGHANQTEPHRTKTLNVNGLEKSLSDTETKKRKCSSNDELRIGSL